MRVTEFRGIKSFRAFQVFQSLVLGIKMLPAYYGKTNEEFLGAIYGLDEKGKETVLRQGALYVELSAEEIEALAYFCVDTNGIKVTAASLAGLGPLEIYELIVMVCVELSKLKVNYVSEDEKKK